MQFQPINNKISEYQKFFTLNEIKKLCRDFFLASFKVSVNNAKNTIFTNDTKIQIFIFF